MIWICEVQFPCINTTKLELVKYHTTRSLKLGWHSVFGVRERDNNTTVVNVRPNLDVRCVCVSNARRAFSSLCTHSFLSRACQGLCISLRCPCQWLPVQQIMPSLIITRWNKERSSPLSRFLGAPNFDPQPFKCCKSKRKFREMIYIWNKMFNFNLLNVIQRFQIIYAW